MLSVHFITGTFQLAWFVVSHDLCKSVLQSVRVVKEVSVEALKQHLANLMSHRTLGDIQHGYELPRDAHAVSTENTLVPILVPVKPPRNRLLSG